MPTYFITAIDTDAGKTVATGQIARFLLNQGKSVITCKLAQTGCEGVAEDILSHRKQMGMSVLPIDEEGKTCPYVFSFPASPHLSARMEGVKIDLRKIQSCISVLEKEYEYVLVEGAGGLLVPLQDDYTIADFLQESKYETLLVTHAKLGSINHTLLSIECLKGRAVPLKGVLFNSFFETDSLITEESKMVVERFMYKYYPKAWFRELANVSENVVLDLDL